MRWSFRSVEHISREERKLKMKRRISIAVLSVLLLGVMSGTAVAEGDIDAQAAQSLAKRNDCFKCHAVDKDKKAPSYRKVAARLKARSYGVDYVIKHITTGPNVRLADDTEEQHKIIDTSDRAELENLARWILSL